MLPAHQRFGAEHHAGGQIDLGLQEQAKLVVFDRGAQLRKQRQRLLARIVRARVVDGHAALP